MGLFCPKSIYRFYSWEYSNVKFYCKLFNLIDSEPPIFGIYKEIYHEYHFTSVFGRMLLEEDIPKNKGP